MRGTLPIVVLISSLGGAGCYGDACEEFFGGTCPPYGGVGGAGGSGGGSTTTGSTSSSTSTQTSSTGLPPSCDPLELMPGQAIDPTCGIFVNADATSGDGSRGLPYATLAEALANNPNGLPIYACAASSPLDETVTLIGSERLVGGVDCTNWQATTTKTSWTSEPNTIPLTLHATAGAHVQSFTITAAAASGFDAVTLDGNDSIAVVADGATATLLQVDIVAGPGAPGGDGEDIGGQAEGRQSNAAAFDGNMGGACGMAGGASKSFTCGGTLTVGGKGGDGDLLVGSGGVAGAPDPVLGEPNGSQGAGDDGTGGWSCGGNGGIGETGHDGPSGPFGAGGTTAGTLSSGSFVGDAGASGMPGVVGQGGGGGGGRKGNGTNGCGAGVNGPSGGGGGAGGCGGLGGGGAGAGGASVALISLNATLTLDAVRLTSGEGGPGGVGGDGQAGGTGGLGGGGGGNACTGGQGGSGGLGGPGGGGAGGPSIGIAFIGSEPEVSDDDIVTPTTAASGGAGGNGNASGNTGAMGLLAKKQSFD